MRITVKGNAFYYSYVEPGTGKRVSKKCRDCTTRAEAEAFARTVMRNIGKQFTVSEICKGMFVPGKLHMVRMAAFGRHLDSLTIRQKRAALGLICRDFGKRDIRSIRTAEVEARLLCDKEHSGSWKNFYLDAFGSIYEETAWVCPYPVERPKFMRFARNSAPTDTFTTDELEALLCKENWATEREFLFFLVTASCGLRLGEARALQVRQFLFGKGMLLIDGFCKPDGMRTCYNKAGSQSDRKIRAVPLPDRTACLVRAYVEEQGKEGEDFVFSTAAGRPLRPQLLDSEFKRVMRKLGWDGNGRKLVPHSLRFTYVTRMRRSVGAETVRLLAGHTAVEMTDYYTRFGVEELLPSVSSAREAANNLFCGM